jgi:hypothetical protein
VRTGLGAISSRKCTSTLPWRHSALLAGVLSMSTQRRLVPLGCWLHPGGCPAVQSRWPDITLSLAFGRTNNHGRVPVRHNDTPLPSRRARCFKFTTSS